MSHCQVARDMVTYQNIILPPSSPLGNYDLVIDHFFLLGRTKGLFEIGLAKSQVCVCISPTNGSVAVCV